MTETIYLCVCVMTRAARSLAVVFDPLSSFIIIAAQSEIGKRKDDELFNPPQTECSRITPCPLPFLHSGFTLLARIGVIRLLI